MKVNVVNKTNFETRDLLDDVQHLLISLDQNQIKNLILNENSMSVLNKDQKLIKKINYNKDQITDGKIRWFNESSGEGVIRLKSGPSIHFYSNNVQGADSLYPQLVSNIKFKEGDSVKLKISSDPYLFKELGAIDIKKIKG